jgi:hypothetical protein
MTETRPQETAIALTTIALNHGDDSAAVDTDVGVALSPILNELGAFRGFEYLIQVNISQAHLLAECLCVVEKQTGTPAADLLQTIAAAAAG